jgi:hypothetical protein
MAFAWVITRDVLEGRDVEIVGPRDVPSALVARLKAGEGRAFRMRDDDGELYFEGRFIEEPLHRFALSEAAFAPLDGYGAPDSGCTSIEYQDASGAWEVL